MDTQTEGFSSSEILSEQTESAVPEKVFEYDLAPIPNVDQEPNDQAKATAREASFPECESHDQGWCKEAKPGALEVPAIPIEASMMAIGLCSNALSP